MAGFLDRLFPATKANRAQALGKIYTLASLATPEWDEATVEIYAAILRYEAKQRLAAAETQHQDTENAV